MHEHVLLRQGLRRLLEDDEDIEIVAEAEVAVEAFRKIAEHQPDLVLIDRRMLGAVADPSAAIRQYCASSRVIFLSDEDVAFRGDHAGIATRKTSASDLLRMVRRVASESAVTNEIRRTDVTEWPVEDLLPRKRLLTERERQVLKLLAEGRTVRSAAGILGLSVKTVDAHKFNLMRKLGIHNKAELVMWAIQKKVVKLPVNF